MGVRQRTPVGADHAVKAELFAQQAGDDAFVKGETDRLVFGINRHTVVGHDHGDAGVDSRLEGRQMIIEMVAGIDLLAAVSWK